MTIVKQQATIISPVQIIHWSCLRERSWPKMLPYFNNWPRKQTVLTLLVAQAWMAKLKYSPSGPPSLLLTFTVRFGLSCFFTQRYTTSTDPEVIKETKTASIQLVQKKLVIMEKNMEGRNYLVTETKTVVLHAHAYAFVRWMLEDFVESMVNFPKPCQVWGFDGWWWRCEGGFEIWEKGGLGFQLNLWLLSNDSETEHTLFTNHTGKSA